MTKNNLFYSENYKNIEESIKDFLNSRPDFLSAETHSSTRAVGDAVQELLAQNFEKILGNRMQKYSASFARRAMADLAFEDKDGNYYIVDVKTHRLDTKFNMPNLTSVERLARFYEDDSNYFVTLIIAYNLSEDHIKVENAHFVPIEFLDWKCLTIGALGWGQIQIANSNRLSISQNTRKQWMLDLCDTLFEFYPSEIGKIKDRIIYFKKVKDIWFKK